MKKMLTLLLALLLTTPVLQTQAAVPGTAAEEMARAEKVLADVAAMQFPTDNTDVKMPCPICGETVTWLAWGMDSEINTRDNRYLENRHLYLISDFTGTEIDDPASNAWGWVFRTAKANTHSVIHLNGKTLKASQGGISSFHGEVNVIGDGYVWGNRGTNSSFGSNLDAGEGATLNIYGGTYYKTSSRPLLYINGEGSTCNIYGGKLEGNDNKADGTVVVENGGSFNMYGGTVETGYLSKEGDSLLVNTDSKACIYGGSVIGGKDKTGGNIYVGGTLEIHGGSISGAIKEFDGKLTITGGQLNSQILGEAITVEGGTFTTDITKFVPEGIQISQKDGMYGVGADAVMGGDVPWLWIAIGGVAVLVVAITVVALAARKKKEDE